MKSLHVPTNAIKTAHIDMTEYMYRIGYYYLARINGFDYWARIDTNYVSWTLPDVNYDAIANDTVEITAYCYGWRWEESSAYMSLINR